MFKRKLKALDYLEWDKVNANGNTLLSSVNCSRNLTYIIYV